MNFSRVRALLGANDNPNLQEFKASIRKLLFYNEVTSSVFANCEDNLNILNISSAASSKRATINGADGTDNLSNEMDDTTQSVDECDDEIYNRYEEIERIRMNGAELQNKEDVTIAYIAGTIEKKVESCRFACQVCEHICRKIFSENEKVDGLFLQNLKTQKPNKSTVIICKYCHEILKHKMCPSKFNYKECYKLICDKLCDEIIFSNTDFSHDLNHKHYLLDYIIDEYIRSYATYVAHCLTLEQQRILIRNQNRKLTHFRGQ